MDKDIRERIALAEHRSWVQMIKGLIDSGAVTEEELDTSWGTNPLLNLIRDWAENYRIHENGAEKWVYRV